MPKKPHYHLQDKTVTISQKEYSDLTNDNEVF